MDQRHVAAEIRAELGRQDLSQADLAASLGWTEAYVSRRLKGRVEFTLADVGAIARTLGVRPGRFLDLERAS
jgi:transcriptional regulator with XRE-family HTH domain